MGLYEELVAEEMRNEVAGDGMAGGVEAAPHGEAVKGRSRLSARRERALGRALEAIQQELEVIDRVRHHDNVVQVRGCMVNPLAIVTEFMSQGSLYECLCQPSHRLYCRPAMSLGRIVVLIRQAAAGLLHLHKEGVLHRDVAARNVLYNGAVAKIADFGFSRFRTAGQQEHVTHSTVGPVCWMAPESLESRVSTSASDVFSFAVTMWELLTGCKPWSHYKNPTMEAYGRVRSGERLPIPATIPPDLSVLLEQCWAHDPSHRPSMDHVLRRLDVWLAAHGQAAHACPAPAVSPLSATAAIPPPLTPTLAASPFAASQRHLLLPTASAPATLSTSPAPAPAAAGGRLLDALLRPVRDDEAGVPPLHGAVPQVAADFPVPRGVHVTRDYSRVHVAPPPPAPVPTMNQLAGPPSDGPLTPLLVPTLLQATSIAADGATPAAVAPTAQVGRLGSPAAGLHAPGIVHRVRTTAPPSAASASSSGARDRLCHNHDNGDQGDGDGDGDAGVGLVDTLRALATAAVSAVLPDGGPGAQPLPAHAPPAPDGLQEPGWLTIGLAPVRAAHGVRGGGSLLCRVGKLPTGSGADMGRCNGDHLSASPLQETPATHVDDGWGDAGQADAVRAGGDGAGGSACARDTDSPFGAMPR